MTDAILVLNAGSSSIKFALFAHTGNGSDIPRQPLLAGQIDGLSVSGNSTATQAGPHLTARNQAGQVLADQTLAPSPHSAENPHQHALGLLLAWLDDHDDGFSVCAVGHRVVHGAQKYAQPIRLDTAIRADLARLIPLAPLHQPHNLDAIRAIAELQPTLPQIACFDTAFHRSQPEIAQIFALPRTITAQGVRRYGFHGLSYEYIATTLPEHLAPELANGRVIVAHLGNGASMCAMHQRQSIATTMGFTALDGLVMGTRTGNLDPGVLLYLMDHLKMDTQAITHLLYKESGLLGVSGLSQDMRELLASNQPEAQQAVDLFCYRISRELGSLAAALGGLDALVFTGGIGEHAVQIRKKVCAAAEWLGIELDQNANQSNSYRISTAAARVAILVLPTNEEWIIARHTAALLQ